MTTHQIGPYTIEQHGEQWRAWRRLETGEIMHQSHEACPHGEWLPLTRHHTDLPYDPEHYGIVRRPVPLPSLGELVEACRVRDDHYSLVVGRSEHVQTNDLAMKAVLRSLLPGYEEQLANIAEMKRLAERPDGVVEDWTTGEMVHLPKPQQFTVPADGWRSIETAPKDGSFVLMHCPNRYLVARWHNGAWVFHEQGEAMWITCEGTHWQPLPPPPNGGEA